MADIQTRGPEVDELCETVTRVRKDCHERLQGLTITPCLLVADNATEIGKVKRIADDIKAVTKDAPDVVLTVWDYWWSRALPSQRDALVDHLLCHIGYSDLSGKCWINRHDFEGFRSEIERRGAWSEELQQARAQMRLWGTRDEGVEAEDEAAEPAGDRYDPETGELLEAAQTLRGAVAGTGATLTLSAPGITDQVAVIHG